MALIVNDLQVKILLLQVVVPIKVVPSLRPVWSLKPLLRPNGWPLIKVASCHEVGEYHEKQNV